MEDPQIIETNSKLDQELVDNSFKAEDINSSLAIIEELVETSQKALTYLDELKPKLSTNECSIIETLLKKINDLVDIIDNNSTPIEIINPNPLHSRKYSSVIERLGIGGEAIRLRQQGLPISRIAKQLSVSHPALSRFYKYYDKLKPSQKSKYQKSSVFDTTSRLEELKNIIVRRMYALEGVNDEVARQYTSELRQTYALAIQITEKIASYEQYKQLTKTVFELIKDELPHKRKEILRKIQAIEKGHLFDA